MRAQTPILNRDERERLHAIVRRATSTRRDIFRAQIILGAADGLSNQAIAAQHKTRPATVSKWRSRFLAQRLAGLGEAPRSGKPARYDAGAEQRILRQLEGPPPPVMPAGTALCWPRRCKTFPRTRAGGCCANMGSACNNAAVGV